MKNNFTYKNQVHSQSQVGSLMFAEAMQTIAEQIELDCFPKEYIPQAREFCLIIAEVYMLPPSADIQIAGQKMTVALVQGIYAMLNHEDIMSVMDNVEKATYEIKHKKTYVRTALYNEVFVRETRAINSLRVMDGQNGYIGTRHDGIVRDQKKKWGQS